MTMAKQTKKISMALLLAVIAFGIMITFFTLSQSLMVATIVLMVTLWTNEGLPLAVVSLLPIVLFPAFGVLSTKETSINSVSYTHLTLPTNVQQCRSRWSRCH